MPGNNIQGPQEVLPYLYSVNPDTVILSAMDVLVGKVCDQIIPPEADRLAFLFKFYTIYLNTIQFTEREIVFGPTSASVADFSKFTMEDRNKTTNMLQKLIEKMTAESAARYLGQLMRTWLLSASRDYLLSGEICGEYDVDNDNRVTIIRKYETTIPRLFELSY